MATPQELFSEAQCYVCYGMSAAQALTLTLEARWLLTLSAGANVAPAALLSYSPCLACYGGGDAFSIMETALLDQISEAG